jgi:hypothetical protein
MGYNQDCFNDEAATTEAAPECARHQMYVAASQIRMAATTTVMMICAVTLFDSLFHRPSVLLSLCIVMMPSLEDAIFNGGIEQARINGKEHLDLNQLGFGRWLQLPEA